MAVTQEEASLRWMEHFGSLEAAEIMDFTDLQQRILVLSASKPFVQPSGLSLQFLPTLGEVEQAIHSGKSKKAPGPDRIPHEIYQIGISRLARHMHALITKSWLRLSEPVRWRGGELIAMAKKLHAGFSPSSHRGILLADVAAKYSHKVLGAKLAPWLQRFQHECHFGCLPGAGTEVPSLWLQAFSALAKFRTVSFGVAFIDIVSAYYRTIRQLIVHMPSNDAELCYLWSHLQIDPAMINQVRTLVSQASALDEAHVPHELQNQLRALFRGTWFFCRGGARIAHTHTGSRPGDPIADITFAFLCNHLMRQMQDFGDQQQLSTKLQVDWVSSVPPADFDEPLVVRPYMTSWADDLALAVIDGDFELLGAKLRCTLRFLLDLAFRHGLDVNLKEDKSEVLLMLRGAGSRQQRHVSFHQGQPTFVVPDTLKGPQVFRLTPSYVHLGVQHTESASILPEIRRRFQSARPVLKVFRSKLRSPALHRHVDATLFRSLVMSRICFGASTWPALNIGQTKFWNGQLHSLYKSLLPAHQRSQPLTSVQVVALTDQLPPPWVIRIRRLSLFDRLCCLAISELWGLLQAGHDNALGWLGLILQDVSKMADLLPRDSELQALRGLAIWELARLCHDSPKFLTRFAKRCVRALRLQLLIMADHLTWLSRFERQMQAAGFTELASSRSGQREFLAASPIPCPDCPRLFATWQAASSHAFRVHYKKHVARRYCFNTICAACHKQYGSREALLMHLKYTRTGCLLWCIRHVQPLSQAASLAFDTLESQARTKQLHQSRHKYFRKPVLSLSVFPPIKSLSQSEAIRSGPAQVFPTKVFVSAAIFARVAERWWHDEDLRELAVLLTGQGYSAEAESDLREQLREAAVRSGRLTNFLDRAPCLDQSTVFVGR